MNVSNISKNAYRVVRSILFTIIILIAATYVLLYSALSVPAVQDKIKGIAERELTELIGGKVAIGNINIYPFNEIIIKDVSLHTPDNQKLLDIGTLGAAISLFDLIIHQKIVITYVEIIQLDARLWQQSSDSPLNIQFIIDAFAPKDKNKPPTLFSLDIRNIVIRKSSIAFDRLYIPPKSEESLSSIDFNHLLIKELSADVAIPKLSNDSIAVDLRSLRVNIDDRLDVDHLSFNLLVAPHNLSLKDFEFRTPHSQLGIEDFAITYSRLAELTDSITPDNPFTIKIIDSRVTPADFECFFTPLSRLTNPYNLTADVYYDTNILSINRLLLSSTYDGLNINISDVNATSALHNGLRDITNLSRSKISIGNISFNVPATDAREMAGLIGRIHDNTPLRQIIEDIGGIDAKISGLADLQEMTADLLLDVTSGIGSIKGKLGAISAQNGNLHNVRLDLNAENVSLLQLLPEIPISQMTAHIATDVSVSDDLLKSMNSKVIDRIWHAVPSAEVDVDIEHLSYRNQHINDVCMALQKHNDVLNLNIQASQAPVGLTLSSDIIYTDNTLDAKINCIADNFTPGIFLDSRAVGNARFCGIIDASLSGKSIPTLQGDINLSDFLYTRTDTDKRLEIDRLSISSYLDNPGDASSLRHTTLKSPYLNGSVTSDIMPSYIIPASLNMMREIAPALLAGNRTHKSRKDHPHDSGILNFAFTIDKSISRQNLFTLPVQPLYPVTIGGNIDYAAGTAAISLDAPYLQQGKDKLIRETALDINIDNTQAKIDFHSIIPTKKGILNLYTDINAANDAADINFHFNPDSDSAFQGDLCLRAEYHKDLNPAGSKAILHFLPTTLYLNDAEWCVGRGIAEYYDNQLQIRDFNIAHGDQHIAINGTASSSTEDMMIVDLSDINLDYIFDALNINYVSFGGTATGQAIATGAFSSTPDAHTHNLTVRDLSYNHCVLGDAKLYGDFNIKEMRVGIKADINENKRPVAFVDGGIWLGGRDSLSFGINADRVRVDFLQTFMQAFARDVSGRASGRGLLYGTFKDIDMTGRFFADTISMRVDYTNVTYSGRDSVFLHPGRVEIPPITLYDKNKNRVQLSGELTHRYFHEPYFHFDVRNANHLLVYDTNPQMNPVWYGRIFGSGSGIINGTPEIVEIIADMTTEGDSDFTFVLDDSMEATDYTFLTFTDSSKERLQRIAITERDEEDAIVAAFNKSVRQQNESNTEFSMDIRATVTPDVKLTLVMDPAAGDKIEARGGGPLNISYSSINDELRMLGKYTLDEGKYNFTLQDLILKDFIIKPGSSVAFNGDPMAAVLNIRAAYRVNTNLTELDRSFATDRDLNRTNVPVDAMLLVTGDMTNPDIQFDIELPTLNEEVAQKVRSIISSEDMMNKQIIYLLALNRFYPTEYMGNTTTGGEWASVASSTLSSQIQNILGQLTDKLTVAPSLHSDKGDFSDLEVDVALSSRLFNNRLLINGNLGYRDPSTSSTTFVGDFDIEYLLTSNGNLRLKAYNHFNDQNYYLKSALTTQGLGIIFRRDFDQLLPRRNRKHGGDSVLDNSGGSKKVKKRNL